MRDMVSFIGKELGGSLDWEYLKAVRQEWDGPLVLKGVLHPAQAEEAVSIGYDGIMVSNHGGRQFDGAPAAISVLPTICEAVGGRAKILFDSGLRGGLDIARALALGADFVLLGRAFMYGVAALGRRGGDHVAEILTLDLRNNMIQLGCSTLGELRDRRIEQPQDATGRTYDSC
jgi:L-lactate dehydrogenase (cytochrome)